MSLSARWAFVLALLPLASGSLGASGAQKQGSPAVCEACHGAHGEGVAAAHVPRLTGQFEEYLKKQLDDYASGARDNPIMANFAKGLNEEERRDFAARYAAMRAPLLGEPSGAGAKVLERGHQLAYEGDEHRQVQACNGCHGPDGSGVAQAAPYLSGQSSEYLIRALKAFRSGSRNNDAGELMRSVATRLNDEDIAAVSAYFAGAGTGVKR
jgi:cytochrome c553